MSVNSQTVIQYWKLIKHHRMEIWLSPEDPWQMVFFSNFIKVECQALRAPGLAIASIILTVSQSPFGTKTTHLRHCFCIEKPANIYIYIYIYTSYSLTNARAFNDHHQRRSALFIPAAMSNWRECPTGSWLFLGHLEALPAWPYTWALPNDLTAGTSSHDQSTKSDMLIEGTHV